jgi:hypothetical protein
VILVTSKIKLSSVIDGKERTSTLICHLHFLANDFLRKLVLAEFVLFCILCLQKNFNILFQISVRAQFHNLNIHNVGVNCMSMNLITFETKFIIVSLFG